jgi:hypothetical protein
VGGAVVVTYQPTELPAGRGPEGDISRRRHLLLQRVLKRTDDRLAEVERTVGSGWVDVSPAANWAVPSTLSGRLRFRRLANTVWMSGSLRYTGAGVAFGATSTVATLPAGSRPGSTVAFPVTQQGLSQRWASVASSGVVVVSGPYSTNDEFFFQLVFEV